MIAVVLLGLALGLDSFRASLAMATSQLRAARTLRVALAFGICDGWRPWSGWLWSGRQRFTSRRGQS